MDSDQAQFFVKPDLGPNCLQRLLADNISRQELDKNQIVSPHPDEMRPSLFSGELHLRSLA